MDWWNKISMFKGAFNLVHNSFYRNRLEIARCGFEQSLKRNNNNRRRKKNNNSNFNFVKFLSCHTCSCYCWGLLSLQFVDSHDCIRSQQQASAHIPLLYHITCKLLLSSFPIKSGCIHIMSLPVSYISALFPSNQELFIFLDKYTLFRCPVSYFPAFLSIDSRVVHIPWDAQCMHILSLPSNDTKQAW